MEETKRTGRNWYDQTYKPLFLIPTILLLLSLIFLFSFYQKTGDIINKDVSLSGGTALTIFAQADIAKLKSHLSEKFEDFNIRELSDLRTRQQQAVIIEVSAEPDEVKSAVEEFLGFKLTEENSSIEFTGASIGAGFYRQLRIAIIIAFILMSLVVFLIFRTFIPGFAVILSAFSDIVMSLALVNILGMKLSAAGIIAFLMLIGYSVDSDILLTTKVLKRRDAKVNARIFSAFKTGITMTLTSIAAVIVSLIIVMSLSKTLTQIFTILTIGLFFDIINTWLMNAGILKLYAQKKKLE